MVDGIIMAVEEAAAAAAAAVAVAGVHEGIMRVYYCESLRKHELAVHLSTYRLVIIVLVRFCGKQNIYLSC